MKHDLSRTNADLQARLNEIGLPAYERLAAQAHLARAEAISDFIVAAVRAVQSLVQSARNLATWPTHRA